MKSLLLFAAVISIIKSAPTIISSYAYASHAFSAGEFNHIVTERATIIGDHAFFNTSGFTSIVIPASVSEIWHRAFASSSVTSVEFMSPHTIVQHTSFESLLLLHMVCDYTCVDATILRPLQWYAVYREMQQCSNVMNKTTVNAVFAVYRTPLLSNLLSDDY